jgi:hypothetical protein
MLLGLVLFKNILPVLSSDHQHSEYSLNPGKAVLVGEQDADMGVGPVFTDSFISDAFHLIVDKLLPLSVQDWESWQEDPEEWFVNQVDVGMAWSFEFRVRLGGKPPRYS